MITRSPFFNLESENLTVGAATAPMVTAPAAMTATTNSLAAGERVIWPSRDVKLDVGTIRVSGGVGDARFDERVVALAALAADAAVLMGERVVRAGDHGIH